jgi:signal transduction histidine kinase
MRPSQPNVEEPIIGSHGRIDHAPRRRAGEGIGQRVEPLLRDALNSIADQVAVLDRGANLIETNRSWDLGRSRACGHAAARGVNYLEHCERLAQREPAMGRLLIGVRGVLEGKREEIRLEFPTRVGKDRRWNAILVSPLRRPGGGAVIVCTDATRQRVAQRQVRLLGRQLLDAHERERRAVARELHDDVTQQLAAAAIDLAIIGRALEPQTAASVEIKGIVDRLKRLSTHVHGLSRRMHPHSLEHFGLARALEGECRAFAERTGLGVTTQIGKVEPAVPDQVALVVFRVCQEALNNVLKHARASSVHAELERTPAELRLSIKDTGVGFSVAETRRGIGLCGMRERAAAVGGRVSITSCRGKGTTVRLVVPLAQEARP